MKCALVHDIGDALAPYNHPSIAAGIVKPFVSPANHWMVEHDSRSRRRSPTAGPHHGEGRVSGIRGRPGGVRR
jgi:predicted HD phosphohydrolase